ncbi:MAG: redoxin domain-containing protein [Ignavibacteriales bacterium]|jgi:thiol-disulfide isomerase/thioredoxin|nr:redoxin domain-containing protein [Ignavibacteriales bacterium]MBP7543734.1 redoxin domain-containing protein [Ignavibacteriaceae bacterium]MBP9123499.1 redoxin domain-containing protein [Ignavibacteriaceae bacterium]
MSKISRTALAVFFSIVSIIGVSAQSNIDFTLKGKLLGSNGKPMPKSDIYVFTDAMSFFASTTPVPVKGDGSFELQFKTPGYYSVAFCGLGHTMYMASIPVFDVKGVTEIEVKLSVTKTELFPNVMGFKSNAGIDFFLPEFVKKGSDGKYSFKIDKKIDTLLVQLTGRAYSTPAGFEYPGAQYVSDSLGGFHTVFYNVKPGFTISVDPTKLPELTGNNTESIVFLSDPANIKEAFDAAEKPNRNFEEVNLQTFNYYKDLFKNGKSKAAKDIAAVQLFTYHITAEYPGVENIEEVINAITADNIAWSRNFYGLTDIIEQKPQAEQSKFVSDIFENTASIDLKMYILYYLKGKPQLVSEEKYAEMFGEYKKIATDEKYAYSLTDLKPAIPLGEQKVEDFTVKMIDGKDFSPKQLEGKYYLIDFWGTWCMPCIEEIPSIEKAYAKFSSKGFEIISLAFNSPEEDFKNQRKKTPMPWLHALLSDADADKLAMLYNVQYIPKMLLVGPDGKIIANEETLRDGGLEKKLEEIFK